MQPFIAWFNENDPALGAALPVKLDLAVRVKKGARKSVRPSGFGGWTFSCKAKTTPSEEDSVPELGCLEELTLHLMTANERRVLVSSKLSGETNMGTACVYFSRDGKNGALVAWARVDTGSQAEDQKIHFFSLP